MGTVNELVHGDLCRRAYADLEEELRRPTPSATRDYVYRCALWHALHTPDLVGKVGQRAAFLSPSGRPLSVARARKRHEDDVVLVAGTRSPLSDAAEAAELTVVTAPAQGPVRELVQLLAPSGTTVALLEETYALPLPLRDTETSRFDPLRHATTRLLQTFGAKVSGVEMGHFAYPGSGIGDAIAIAQREPFTLAKCSELGQIGTGLLSRSRALVVNADHPTVISLVRLSAREPELAAYLLAKLFFLGSRLDVEVDGALAAATVALRAR